MSDLDALNAAMDDPMNTYGGAWTGQDVRSLIQRLREIEASNKSFMETWNHLIFALSPLAKAGAVYEGETDGELVALIASRLHNMERVLRTVLQKHRNGSLKEGLDRDTEQEIKTALGEK